MITLDDGKKSREEPTQQKTEASAPHLFDVLKEFPLPKRAPTLSEALKDIDPSKYGPQARDSKISPIREVVTKKDLEGLTPIMPKFSSKIESLWYRLTTMNPDASMGWKTPEGHLIPNHTNPTKNFMKRLKKASQHQD